MLHSILRQARAHLLPLLVFMLCMLTFAGLVQQRRLLYATEDSQVSLLQLNALALQQIGQQQAFELKRLPAPVHVYPLGK